MSQRRSLTTQFAKILADLNPGDAVLDRFCEAGQLLLDADGAAITVNYDHPDRHTLSSTSDLARMIEDAQDVVGEGPGFDARCSGSVVSQEFGLSTMTSTPWPLFEGSVASLNFTGTILAVPIVTGDRSLGVLVVHRLATSLTFDLVAAEFLVHALGAALVELLTPQVMEEELTDEWSSRAVVHQATGMMTVQLGIGADDALVVLRAHTYAEGSSLVEMARQVVQHQIVFGDARPEEG